MDRVETPLDEDYPPVIWQTSIPYSWKRIFEKKRKTKSRPLTSKSLRTIKDSHGTLDTFDKQCPTLEHLYFPSSETLGSSQLKTQSSPRAAGNVFYTTKYLGITNGEIGILSQRKPLTPSQGSRRPQSQGRPCTQQFSRNTTSKDLAATSPVSQSPTDQLPTEFLRPNPDRYDEFLIHTYTRPHPLTPVKKPTSPMNLKRKTPMFQSLDTMRYQRANQEIKPAKIERTGVSGWKLTRPKTRSSVNSARNKAFPATKRSEPGLTKTIKMMEWSATRRNEAYLQYLYIKNQLKE